jgi:hypothetical protein
MAYLGNFSSQIPIPFAWIQQNTTHLKKHQYETNTMTKNGLTHVYAAMHLDFYFWLNSNGMNTIFHDLYNELIGFKLKDPFCPNLAKQSQNPIP